MSFNFNTLDSLLELLSTGRWFHISQDCLKRSSSSEARSDGQHLWSKLFSYKGLLAFLLGAHFCSRPRVCRRLTEGWGGSPFVKQWFPGLSSGSQAWADSYDESIKNPGVQLPVPDRINILMGKEYGEGRDAYMGFSLKPPRWFQLAAKVENF